MSSNKRTLIALMVLVAATAGLGLYIHRANRSLHPTYPEPVHPVLGERRLDAGRGPDHPSDILDRLPTNAPFILYVDVGALRKLQGTPLAAFLGLTNGAPRGDADYREFVRKTGFDYTRDLSQVAVAFWPAPLGAGSGDALKAQQVFAVAEGRFDEGKIKAYALRTGKVVTRGTMALYEVPGNPPVSLEFPSPGRIAIASGKNCTDLLTKSSSTPDVPVHPPIERDGSPIFGLARADRLPGDYYANLKNSPQLERLARSVQVLTLTGQPQGDILKMVLDGETNSLKNALEIAALLEISRVGSSMALADPGTNRQLTKEQTAFLSTLVKHVRISRQGRMVRLALDITPEMLSNASPLSSGASAETH
jgi:hypothetical protein